MRRLQNTAHTSLQHLWKHLANSQHQSTITKQIDISKVWIEIMYTDRYHMRSRRFVDALRPPIH